MKKLIEEIKKQRSKIVFLEIGKEFSKEKIIEQEETIKRFAGMSPYSKIGEKT